MDHKNVASHLSVFSEGEILDVFEGCPELETLEEIVVEVFREVVAPVVDHQLLDRMKISCFRQVTYWRLLIFPTPAHWKRIKVWKKLT